MIAKLITKFFNFILSLITSVVSLILTPITRLVTNLLPDLSSYVATFDNFVNTAFDGIGFFFSILGPVTRGIIALEFNLISIFFTIYAGYITYEVTIYLVSKVKGMFL